MNFKTLLYLAKFLPSELAHNIAILALKLKLFPKYSPYDYKILNQKIFGMNFLNPLGLAAGFDKNAEAIEGLLSQGFSHIEVGTVTPLPQKGNKKPRLYRLDEDKAIINRMGFNNVGAEKILDNLRKIIKKDKIIGVNIGKNKNSEDAINDYILLIEKFYEYASYFTINISSPNTPNLRELQEKGNIEKLLKAINLKKIHLVRKYGKDICILIKLSPDLDDEMLKEIAILCNKYMIDGVLLTNTTVTRPENLISKHKNQLGGLSGKPIFDISTHKISVFYKASNGKIPIIALGGIFTAEDAYRKILAGASLIQIYSAIIFNGFNIIPEINNGIKILLEKDGYKHISEAIGKNIEK